jgi:hypothetical protein
MHLLVLRQCVGTQAPPGQLPLARRVLLQFQLAACRLCLSKQPGTECASLVMEGCFRVSLHVTYSVVPYYRPNPELHYSRRQRTLFLGISFLHSQASPMLAALCLHSRVSAV